VTELGTEDEFEKYVKTKKVPCEVGMLKLPVYIRKISVIYLSWNGKNE